MGITKSRSWKLTPNKLQDGIMQARKVVTLGTNWAVMVSSSFKVFKSRLSFLEGILGVLYREIHFVLQKVKNLSFSGSLQALKIYISMNTDIASQGYFI